MAIPETPKHIEPLQLPLPWEPSRRIKTLNKYWRENALDWSDDENDDSLRDYIDLADSQYIMTGKVVQAVQSAVTWLHPNWPLVAEIYTDDYPVEHDDLIESFETEALGVEPGKSWRELQSGFGGGEYDKSTIAALVGICADDYDEYIAKTSPHPSGAVYIRSGNYLVLALTRSDKAGPEKVFIGEVSRLSKIGIAVLESTLGAYELGKNETEQP
mgnify:CR=1 FL=1